jgi:hypothetical protein
VQGRFGGALATARGGRCGLVGPDTGEQLVRRLIARVLRRRFIQLDGIAGRCCEGFPDRCVLRGLGSQLLRGQLCPYSVIVGSPAKCCSSCVASAENRTS